MVERAVAAVSEVRSLKSEVNSSPTSDIGLRTSDFSIEILDLRTIVPYDKEAILESVKKTNRVLVLSEDNWTCNFAAEICATITQEAFEYLDAPVERLATPDVPIPYNVGLMNAVLPGVEEIARVIEKILRF
jgi:2-oxoisovalerate dehydrogenase E1 component